MRRAVFALLVLAGAACAQTQPKPTVEALLSQLKAAATEESAAALEMQIRAQWAEAASPAVRLLILRGRRELSDSAPNDAVDSFDAALDLEPNLLEGWRGRAQARQQLGDYAGAVRDIQELLKREPRSFLAWQDLSRIAEARSDWRGALAAWQKLLDIDPHTANAQTRLRDLRRHALGEET